MDEFRDSIRDLKKDLSDFIKSHYEEIIKIWKSISVIETKQKTASAIYGLIGGVIGSIISGSIIFILFKK